MPRVTVTIRGWGVLQVYYKGILRKSSVGKLICVFFSYFL